jgi:hypothetical protein
MASRRVEVVVEFQLLYSQRLQNSRGTHFQIPFGTDPGIPGMPAIPPIPDIPPVPGRAVALGMALDAALGIPLAELLAAVAIEETMDPRLETVEMADVTAGRLPLPLPSGATQPFTPGRLTQTLYLS